MDSNDKAKVFMVFGILSLIVAIAISSTYAWYVWTTSEEDTIKIVTGVGSAKVYFNGGSDISANLRPVSDKSKGIVKNISIKADTTDLTFNLYLDINSIDNELKHSSFRYALYNGSTEITSGNFANYTAVTCTKNNTNHIVLLSNQSINTTTTTYTLYIWIDGVNEVNPSSMMNKTFSFNLHADGQGAVLKEEASTITLNRLNALNSSIAVDTSKTPDFSKVSGDVGYYGNTEVSGDGTLGLYTAEDDDGTSYYFRGAVDNNYVKFGDYLWRIVRINGDGSIRMIYQEDLLEIKTRATVSTGGIGATAYNKNYDDNAYVGYMYGTPGSSTYEATHSNTNASTIKTYVDEWYDNNLASYEEYIQSTTYCNDRSVTAVGTIGNYTYNGNGIGTSVTSYSGFTRNHINSSATPSLKCTNANDRLTLKIGLITSDEVVFAGIQGYNYSNHTFVLNYDFYLYSDYWYWTMTPNIFAGGDANVGSVDGVRLGSSDVGSTGGSVRPVVSLKSDAISGGQGTYTDPFTIG